MGVICTQEQCIIYTFESTVREFNAVTRGTVFPTGQLLLSRTEITETGGSAVGVKS